MKRRYKIKNKALQRGTAGVTLATQPPKYAGSDAVPRATRPLITSGTDAVPADLKELILEKDGKASSAMLVSAFLLFVGFVRNPEDAAQLFAVRRTPPGLQPSEMRYLHYLADVLRSPPYCPHFKPMKLVSITLQPVPLFNKVRDGCRPYVEVYQGEERVMSTQQEYERMTLFNITHGKITLPLNVTVVGDVTLVVYHARHVLGRPTGIKILQLQLHTGFIAGNTLNFTNITHKRLDGFA
ncbi:hypothetical protein J6590_034886 [Homalodisca vitripennis]|nr:hypothetical protein J6590_034886 [Homalodisca vitripennis]